MALPLTLLNKSNRQLRENVEELTLELTRKQYDNEDYHNVIRLLKEHRKHIQRELETAQASLSAAISSCERKNSALLQLHVQNDGERKRLAQLHELQNRFEASLSRFSLALQEKQSLLKESKEKTMILEEMVKKAITNSAAVLEKEDAIKLQIQGHSYTEVFLKLEKAQQELQKMEGNTKEVTEEHTRVVAQLDTIQKALSTSYEEKNDISSNIEAIRTEYQKFDTAITCNTTIMSEYLAEGKMKEEEKTSLEARLAEVKKQSLVIQGINISTRQRFDNTVVAMRKILQELIDQSHAISIVKRAKQKVKRCTFAAQETMQNSFLQIDEHNEVLRGLKAYHQQLEDCMKEPLPTSPTLESPASLDQVLKSLQQYFERLENRSFRLQEKLNIAVSELEQEGKETGSANDVVLTLQRGRQEQEKVMLSTRESVIAIRNVEQKIEDSIIQITEEIAQAQQMVKEEVSEKSINLQKTLASLQEKLTVELNRYKDLRNNITTSKIHLHRAADASLHYRDSELAESSKRRLLENEVEAMEKELVMCKGEVEALSEQHLRLNVTHQLLKGDFVKLLDSLSASAGAEELLRGQIGAIELQMEAERKQKLLELHLEQNALSSMKEDQNRLEKKLELIIMRYKDSIQRLGRAANEETLVPIKIERSIIGSENATDLPEVLHARYLLSKSCEREQLLKRGNFLDQQIVLLSKEVETLKKCYEAMLNCQSGQKDIKNSLSGKTIATSAFVKQEIALLENSTIERDELLRKELSLLEESIGATESQKIELQNRLKELRTNLKELKIVHQKKRLEYGKLQDSLRKAIVKKR